MRGNETDNKPPKYSKLNLEYQDFNYKTTSFESIFLSLLHHNDIIFHTIMILFFTHYVQRDWLITVTTAKQNYYVLLCFSMNQFQTVLKY